MEGKVGLPVLSLGSCVGRGRRLVRNLLLPGSWVPSSSREWGVWVAVGSPWPVPHTLLLDAMLRDAVNRVLGKTEK